MGIITIEKANHLFWLGRYAERMTGTIRMYMECFDQLIDVDDKAYINFCNRLSIPYDCYKDADDFITSFVYDINNPDSLVSAINMAYSNAVVLREEITGDTLAYIDLAKRILEKEEPGTLMLELQKVLDDINAFWGSASDTMEETCRSIVKCGKHAEKLDIQFRFDIADASVQRDLNKLKHRISVLAENYDIPGLQEVKQMFANEKAEYADYIAYIEALSNCFSIR